MRNKSLRKYNIAKYLPVFIILLAISIIIGSTFAYFTDKADKDSSLTFSKVELSSETTTGINGVIYDALPGAKLVNGALKFSKSIDSEPIYVRAKLSYSLPTGASAGMSEILDALRSANGYTIETNLPNGAKWSEKEGNYFYLLDSDDDMFRVDTIDTYTLTSELVIPRDLEALDGNAQYMESINFHVAFEAIQADNISTNINDIKAIFSQVYPESEAEVIRYRIVISNQGESQSQMYNAGEVIESLDEPELDGYEFAGWFTNDGSESGEWGEEIIFPYIVNRNISMFAKFEEVRSFNINYYNEDFTSIYKTVVATNKAKATSIDYDKVEVNETFIGWFTDTTFETMFDFSGEITSDVNVYPLVKQETSLTDFIFNGSQITEYKGSATEVVIPETYSIGERSIQTVRIGSQREFEEMFMYDTPNLVYPVTFTDRLNQTYTVNAEYELYDIYFNVSSSNYPIRYVTEVAPYIEGTDYNITSIDNAFSSSRVQIIYLPNSFTTVGGFNQCSTLTNIYFSSNVTSIEASAFASCTNLALTSLPDGVTSIGSFAFTYCDNLALTSLPAGLTNIGLQAFTNCSKITLTELPAGVTSIPDNAFVGCSNLALTSLPAGVTSIGSYSFQNCTNLALTSLPAGLTNIGTSAFIGCSNLALTSLSAGLTSIGDSAFSGCSKLALTSIPAGVTNIGYSAFNGCTLLPSNDSVYYLTVEGTSNNVVIKAKSTSISSVNWPESVTMIGSGAFEGCSNLVLTSLPAGVETIGYSAFNGCTLLPSNNTVYYLPIEGTSNNVVINAKSTSITSIDWPDNVTMIVGKAFNGCSNLTLISLPDGLTEIGYYTFQNCTNLALTSLPAGVTNIGNGAFRSCTNLALTSLPAGMTKIDGYAFYLCTNLALTSLPTGVTSIGDYAFSRCTNLALTSLPTGVTSIGSSTFEGCSNIVLTSLPDGLTSISNWAFSGCSNIVLTSLPDGLTSISFATFYGCASLALTELPSGVTSIDDYAFYQCTNLALTSLPAGVTRIGSGAFEGCTNLALISLPASVTSISTGVFNNCTNLNYILCETSNVATLVPGTGRSDTYIYSMQANGYANGTVETEVVISDTLTIYTATVDGYKWVRNGNKYYKCIVANS